MKILIAYSTKHGFAEKCSETLSKKLEGEVTLCNLKKDVPSDLEKYDTIIIGGSIYMGQIQKEVQEFCSKNLTVLKEKKIGLFTCCMRENADAVSQLNSAFPQELLDIAVAKGAFGGEFIMNKLNFFEKLIVKNVVKITKDTTMFSEENFNKFAQEINKSNI